jgi:chaperone modulatory protein CbpM
MTVETNEFIVHARLDAEVLETWISAGWLAPREEAEMRHFSEIDLARAELIRDLTHGMGVNEEGIAVILDLVDQLHGVRQALREILSAVAAQPEPLRRRIIDHARDAASRGGDRATAS